MKIGYIRVSTNQQDARMQREALEKHGCEKIYDDIESGAKSGRDGLHRALDALRPGDCLVVWKLDRLGRTVKSLISFVEGLQSKEVDFASVTESIDTSTPAGRFFFHLMASFAQMERELLIERTRAGLESARKRGRVGGRSKAMDDRKVEAAKAQLNAGIPAKEVAQNMSVSVATLYRYLPANSRE